MYPILENQAQNPSVAALLAARNAQAMREAQAQDTADPAAAMNMLQLAQLRNRQLDPLMYPPPTNSAQTAQNAMPMYLQFMGGGAGGMMGGGGGGGMLSNI